MVDILPDGTHSLAFLNSAASNLNDELPPIRLTVRAIKYREACTTRNGTFAVCNVELYNFENIKVFMSGWREKAPYLAKLLIGGTYLFTGGRALDCRDSSEVWYRIGMDSVASKYELLAHSGNLQQQLIVPQQQPMVPQQPQQQAMVPQQPQQHAMVPQHSQQQAMVPQQPQQHAMVPQQPQQHAMVQQQPQQQQMVLQQPQQQPMVPQQPQQQPKVPQQPQQQPMFPPFPQQNGQFVWVPAQGQQLQFLTTPWGGQNIATQPSFQIVPQQPWGQNVYQILPQQQWGQNVIVPLGYQNLATPQQAIQNAAMAPPGSQHVTAPMGFHGLQNLAMQAAIGNATMPQPGPPSATAPPVEEPQIVMHPQVLPPQGPQIMDTQPAAQVQPNDPQGPEILDTQEANQTGAGGEPDQV